MINHDSMKYDREEEFYYFGKCYDIVYGFNEIEIVNDKIYASNKKELEKYLDKEIRRIYLERLNYFYNLFEEDIPVPNLKIRKMTSRWGVCNISSMTVTLNVTLITKREDLIDYVIIH